MASMNIREVDVTSLARFKARASAEGMTLRAWVLAVLQVALMDDAAAVSVGKEVAREPVSQPVDPATCRRCDAAVLPDPKNPKMWYCRACKRQLDKTEVRQ